MRIEHLRQRLADLGAKPVHIQRILRAWTHAQPLDAGPARRGPMLPQPVLDALPAIAADLAGLTRLRSAHPADDGSARLLVELPDGQTIESVLLPRDGLCVSSQVGCTLNCSFCHTGTQPLVDTGQPDNVMVLREGAGAEINSAIGRGQAAILSALPGFSLSAAAVAYALDQDARRNKRPPRAASVALRDERLRDLRVVPHDLAAYDRLTHKDESE